MKSCSTFLRYFLSYMQNAQIPIKYSKTKICIFNTQNTNKYNKTKIYYS